MKSPIEAVLFDLDGTIIDTSEFVYQAFEYTLESHKHSPRSRDDLAKTMGLPVKKAYQQLSQQEDIEHLFASHTTYQIENMHLAVPFADLENVLKTLKEKGIKTAVVTARGRVSTESILKANKLIKYFDTTITLDEVTNSKPDPEGIQLALKQLGISKEEAIMTGDTEIDILAGKNAGVRTIGVTYGFQGETIQEYSPDYIVNSLSEILPIILQ